MVVLVALTGSCGGGDSPVGTGKNDTTSTRSDSATGELAYFAPDPLLDNARVMTASISAGPASDLGGSTIVIGRLDGDGFTAVLRVLVTSASEGEDPSSYDGVSKVDLGGVDGYALDHPLVGANVSWLDESWLGTVVGPAGAADVVLEVARAVEVDGDGAAQLAELPTGYGEIASFASDGGHTTPSWSLALAPADGSQALLSIDGSLVPAGAPASLFAIGDRLGTTSVRGREAVTAERAIRYPGQNVDTVLRSLAWLERPDLAITVRGTGSAEDLVAVAESLQEINEAAFTALQEEQATPSPPLTSLPVTRPKAQAGAGMEMPMPPLVSAP